MNYFLEWLSSALVFTPAVALIAAFIWGILSVVLSPCHLASFPLIVGFVSEQKSNSLVKAFRLSLVLAVGILITITVVGVITAAMGKIIGDIGSWGNYVVAAFLTFFGLYLLDIVTFEWNGASFAGVKGKGYLAALSIGLIFGIALGPCTFAYMAPMLGVVFNVASSSPLFAISLLLAFGLGHCLVIVMAGTLTERVQQYLYWNEKTKAILAVRKASGGLILLGALYLIYNA